jgi:hypothetical protein
MLFQKGDYFRHKEIGEIVYVRSPQIKLYTPTDSAGSNVVVVPTTIIKQANAKQHPQRKTGCKGVTSIKSLLQDYRKIAKLQAELLK